MRGTTMRMPDSAYPSTRMIYQGNDPVDGADLKLPVGQTQDSPASQRGFEILFRVVRVTCSPGMSATATDEDSALDLDQRAAVQVGEVGTPFPRRVELVFTLKRGTLGDTPEELELGFEL